MQLREEFDSGHDVQLTADDYSPHDVGGLLKEFLRDLPDPLLCRELYSAFVATASACIDGGGDVTLSRRLIL